MAWDVRVRMAALPAPAREGASDHVFVKDEDLMFATTHSGGRFDSAVELCDWYYDNDAAAVSSGNGLADWLG